LLRIFFNSYLGIEQTIQKEDIHISMLSATFPRQVKKLAEDYLRAYIYIGIGNKGESGSINNCIKQQLVDTRNENKNSILFDLIGKIEGKLLSKVFTSYCLISQVFCATKRTVSNVYNYLNSRNLFVSQIHGDLNQHEREVNRFISFRITNLNIFRLSSISLKINVVL